MSRRSIAALGLGMVVCAAGCGGSARTVVRAPARRTPTLRMQVALPARPRRRQGGDRPSAHASAALVTHGPRTRRLVALTFDADMTPGMLARLRSGRQRTWLDRPLFGELERTHTPATIFLTGMWTQTYPNFVRKLARDPLFELENHSYDHAAWLSHCYGLATVTSPLGQRREVTLAQKIIKRVAGRAPRYFRFPGGCVNAADRQLVARLGLTPVGWDVVSGDPFNPNPDSIVRAVLTGVRPGSIVVAHCIGAPNAPATAAAMARIIPALEARGYRFTTLAHLLGRRA